MNNTSNNTLKKPKQFFSATESKVRLVMFFKNGYLSHSGSDLEVQYSLLNMNKKASNQIIQAMEVSFLEKKYPQLIKTAIFYDNATGHVLKKLVDGIQKND